MDSSGERLRLIVVEEEFMHAARYADVLIGRLAGGDDPAAPDVAAAEEKGAWLEQARPVLERLAASELGIVILGETGAGKGHLAQLLHAHSQREGA